MKDWMKMGGVKSHEITNETVFRRRRALLQASVAAGLTGSIVGELHAKALPQPIVKGPFNATDEITSEETATSYNNFYELGTDKGDPLKNADKLVTEPWSVVVDGECDGLNRTPMRSMWLSKRSLITIYRA